MVYFLFERKSSFQATNEVIPPVVRSCIRIINLYGMLKAVCIQTLCAVLYHSIITVYCFV